MDSTDRSAGANDGILIRAVSRLRGAATSTLLFWIYLLLITIAELVISIPPAVAATLPTSGIFGLFNRLLVAVGPAQFGLMIHMAIMLALIVNTVFGVDEAHRKLARALTLGPLIRILSVGMPLRLVPQVAWYPLVSTPLLIATWIIIRQTGVSRRSLGLQRGNLKIQLLLVGGGFGLGALEYAILHPAAIGPSIALQALVIPALSLLIFTGFTEELIFRGLLQALAIPVLGSWALTYVALLFGVLHIGYQSFWDVVFVFLVGFVFAYIAKWSGSILGLTGAHGVTNTMLFLVLPYLNAHPEHPLAPLMPAIVIVGTALSLIGIGMLWQQLPPEERPVLPLPQLQASATRAAQWTEQSVRQFPRIWQFRTAIAFAIGTFFGLAVSGMIFDLRNRPPSVAVAPATPERGTPVAAGGAVSTPTIGTTEVAVAIPTITVAEPADVASPTPATSPTTAATSGATATPAPVSPIEIAELPWPEFLPDGLSLAVADSWPFQVSGAGQAAEPFLVFRDGTRWLTLRRQPEGEMVIPASATVQRLKIGESPARLVSYLDDGFTLTWESAGIPLQLSAVGLTVDDAVRVGARLIPQTPAELQARLAEGAPQVGGEITTLWPENLPAGFEIVPEELSMEFSDPTNDDSLAGYTVTFARGNERFMFGGGTLAPPTVNGPTERISAGDRSAELVTGENRFLLTVEGDPSRLPVPAASSPVIPLVHNGRVFAMGSNLDRATFNQLVASLLPLRPQEFAARVAGRNLREIPYLWPENLPQGYSLYIPSTRTSWSDYVLQGDRPYYELTATAARGGELTIQGGGDAYVLPEGPDVEQVNAKVHDQGATAVRSPDESVVFWTENGNFYTVRSSSMELDELIAFANSLQPISASTFNERIQ